MVALLAGGTGGAKLARGLLDAVGAEQLSVIVNTADDVHVHGVRVSPDPDLVTYRLADRIDERLGYGLRGDSHHTMEALDALGRPTWFRLGDRDLATCLMRSELLRAGERPTTVAARIARALGVEARVLPMSDDPVATRVHSGGRWLGLQEFLIREPGAPVDGVELEGIEEARPTQDVIEAIGSAEVILIGPSNPVISIGPILGLAGARDTLAAAPAPVIAVSPFVGGRAIKGPTEAFCRHAGLELGAAGIARAYTGLLDGIVADEPLDSPDLPAIEVDTLMDTVDRQAAVAVATLEFARSLTTRAAVPTRSALDS